MARWPIFPFSSANCLSARAVGSWRRFVRRKDRAVRKIGAIPQRLALRIGEGIRRQRKVDRLSLLPTLRWRVRADDRTLGNNIDGEFPPVAPIGAVEGAHRDGVDAGRVGPACRLKLAKSEALTLNALAAELAKTLEPLTEKLSLAAPPVPLS